MPVPRIDPPASRGRREFLRLGGAAIAAAFMAACASDRATAGDTNRTTRPAPPATTLAALTVADFSRLGTCRLAPEKTPGPFPLEQKFVRRDITEKIDGHPVRLGFRVVDSDCIAVPGAAVEIWHTDPTGDYSAFVDDGGGKDEGAGTTFLRGTQRSDANGIVEFHTIYPGWYRGRAIHIHLRVHQRGTTVLTSQVFFDDEYTQSVFRASPYATLGNPDTTNDQDSIAGSPKSEGTLLMTRAAPTARGSGTLALINLRIDSAAQ